MKNLNSNNQYKPINVNLNKNLHLKSEEKNRINKMISPIKKINKI